MEIIKLKVSEIKEYENNAKEHTEEQIEQIKESIIQFGFNDPIAVDENNVIIEGHGRLYAIKQLGYEDVDCIKLTHLTEEKKKAYILAHNKLTMNTGFDFDKLKLELDSIQELDMSLFGFSPIVEDEDEETFESDEDAAPRFATKKGDMYLLGDHLILCDDGSNKKVLAKLIQGEKMINRKSFSIINNPKTVDKILNYYEDETSEKVTKIIIGGNDSND